MNAIALLVVTVVAATASAQVPYSDGPLAGVGAAFSLRQPGFPHPQDDLLIKGVGFTDVMPGPWSQPPTTKRPDFGFAALFGPRGAGCPGAGADIDVDDVSTGLDQIWSDDTGQVTVPSGLDYPWNVLAFSVDPNAGAAGSVIEQERLRTDGKAGVQGDVFSYVLSSSSLPAGLPGVTMRALDATEMGLQPTDDIDALDLPMRMFELDDAMVDLLYTRLPTGRVTLFFTVSGATQSLAATPGQWFNGTPKSGATILRTTWDGMGWTCPMPFRTFNQLGLSVTDDILMLCVDVSRGYLLICTKYTPSRLDPIVFYAFSPGFTSAPAVYRFDTDGTLPVSGRIGLNPNQDVDAGCDLDPSLLTGQINVTSLNHAVGSPLNCQSVLTTRLNASLFRDVIGSNVVIRSFLNGWPTAVKGSGYAIPYVNVMPWPLPTVQTCPSGLTGGVFDRSAPANPLAAFCGGPTEYQLALPPIVPPGWSQLAIEISWLAIPGNIVVGQSGYTYPVSFVFP